MSKEFTKHDHFFNKVMSDPNVARDFCLAYLPDEIKCQTDFSTLIFDRCDTKVVTEGLKSYEIADLLYKVMVSGKLAYLLLHVEHQSTADRLMPIRVISYGSGILLEYASLHPKEPLPLIISLVYYHGKPHPYPYPIHLTDLFENLSAKQKEYIFKPILIDLSTYDDQLLRQHGDMAPVDILFKHIFDVQSQDNLKLILSELTKANHKIRYYSVRYMMKRVNLSEEDFVELALKYLDEEDIMTVEEQMEQRLTKRITERITERVTQSVTERVTQRVAQRVAKQEKYAIARNMLKKDMPIDMISEITGLSVVLVKELESDQVRS